MLRQVTTLLLATTLAAAAYAEDEPAPRQPIGLRATVGYHYSTGKYGGDDSTDIMFVPVTLAAGYDAFTLRLTVPWIRVDGVPETDDDGQPIFEGGTAITGNGNGIGDVTLAAIYTIFPMRDWAPFIDLGARIKFPTADEDEGLGTGKFDYELNVEIAKVLGDLTPFANLGYRFVGNPDDFDLDDSLIASLGAVYRLHERINSGLFLYYQETSSVAADDQLDLMPYLEWAITPAWVTSTYVTVGLQDGSPDFGIGLQLTYRASY